MKVSLTKSKKGAIVSLSPKVDRSLVPSRDFVLYIRDEGISEPSAISTDTQSGCKAVNIKILPDSSSEHVKSRIRQEVQNRQNGDFPVDMTPDVRYERNELE